MRFSREGPADAKMRALIGELQAKARQMFSDPVKFYYRQMTLRGEEMPHRTVVALSFGGPAYDHQLEPFREIVQRHAQSIKPQASIPTLQDFFDPFLERITAKHDDEEKFITGEPHGIKFVAYSRVPLTVMKQFEAEHFVSTRRIE